MKEYFLYPFFVTIILYLFYIQLFKKYAPVADVNHRSLHKSITSTGGGIIFSMVFIISIILLSKANYFSNDYFLNIAIGGIFASLFGLADDYYDIGALQKLIFQIFLAVFILLCLHFNSNTLFLDISNILIIAIYAGVVLFLVWIMNVLNFIDGINGLAASSGVIISWSIAGIIFIQSGDIDSFYYLVMLGTVCLAFLVFNFPKAYIFMGDSGSLFLGYILGAIAMKTIHDQELSIWTWGIMTAYIMADTTITTLIRFIKVEKWYGVHRSHAYQHISAIMDNHTLVTFAIILIHLIWLLPSAILSVFFPKLSILLFFTSITPIILIVLKYGPNYSNRLIEN